MPSNISSEQKLVIGLMSGTSLDGVDAVLATFDPAPQTLADAYIPFDAELKSLLLSLNTAQPDELHLSARAANELSIRYAEVVQLLLAKANVRAEDILAIGNHGQTIRHRPDYGYTLQIGNHALLAELTGIPVVGDFRSRDIAAGGQGAPLVPAFHLNLFASDTQHVGVLNIGGIANLTCLPAGGGMVRGFDTGPGNLLMDYWCGKHTGFPYDKAGAWAKSGTLIPSLLADWLAHAFFHLPPPKSTGRDLFNPAWLESHELHQYQAQDVQATLLALTATSVANSVKIHLPEAEILYLCGGGAHNMALREHIASLLPDTHIGVTDDTGVPGDTLEAFAFAWLAWRFCQRQTGNLPQVTGARGERILGAYFPA